MTGVCRHVGAAAPVRPRRLPLTPSGRLLRLDLAKEDERVFWRVVQLSTCSDNLQRRGREGGRGEAREARAAACNRMLLPQLRSSERGSGSPAPLAAGAAASDHAACKRIVMAGGCRASCSLRSYFSPENSWSRVPC